MPRAQRRCALLPAATPCVQPLFTAGLFVGAAPRRQPRAHGSCAAAAAEGRQPSRARRVGSHAAAAGGGGRAVVSGGGSLDPRFFAPALAAKGHQQLHRPTIGPEGLSTPRAHFHDKVHDASTACHRWSPPPSRLSPAAARRAMEPRRRRPASFRRKRRTTTRSRRRSEPH